MKEIIDNSNQSVLKFYAISWRAALAKDWKVVWDEEVIDRVDNNEVVRCTNIWHYNNISPSDLAAIVRHHRLSTEEIDDIKQEYRSGATMMWVSPMHGPPVYGIYIENILVPAAQKLLRRLDNESNN